MWRMLLAAGLSLAAVSGSGGQPVWRHDYAEALRLAKAQSRMVLAVFTGSDWCPASELFRNKILASPQFRNYVTERFILLELDFPSRQQQPEAEKEQNRKLQKQFKVAAFPTLLVLNDRGAVLVRTGYFPSSPGEYVRLLQQLVKNATGAKNEQSTSSVHPDAALGRRRGMPVNSG